MELWTALGQLEAGSAAMFLVALVVAFGFEFINGFHDTANAVTTVIYTRSLKPTPAVVYSGFLNFLGVLLGGTAVAFSIVQLLPVDLLIEASSKSALVMVLSLLLAGVIWNLGTWYLGLPVSSSHTLIGSILGVGFTNSLLTGIGLTGLNWEKVVSVFQALLLSPVFGFVLAALLLLGMKRVFHEPRLYIPPQGDDRPPTWIRAVLIGTCGGVSFAHGSNDGQKGMGLILLVLIGFLPAYYALNPAEPGLAREVYQSAVQLKRVLNEQGELSPRVEADIDVVIRGLEGKESFADVSPEQRWAIRKAIYTYRKDTAELPLTPQTAALIKPYLEVTTRAIEFVPTWVVVGVALALGIGTTIGYQRIVTTVAEKIGKTHLTYGQGAAAEMTAAATILAADMYHLPVSTTHVLSSGVAGTMVANGSGVQGGTIKKIALAWVLTLPASMLLASVLYAIGRLIIG